MNLATSIEQISRIGPLYQRKLKKLGIQTVRDLLYHFPHRYEDFSNLIPISQAKLGEKVCIQGEILDIKNTKTWKKRMFLTQAIIKDNTGAIKVIWFNQPYIINVLKEGGFVCLAGKISLGAATKKSLPELYLASPSYEKIGKPPHQEFGGGGKFQELTHVGRIVPVYPETEGLSSRWLRYILKPLLLQIKDKIQDPLPEEIREKEEFLPLKEAFWQIHFPDSINLAKKAQARFSFEELFNISLLVLRERLKLKKSRAIKVFLNLEIVKSFINSLPFKLTDGQKKSAWQVLKDLEKPRPMNRLLEGDVGSGKTVVAIIAALNVAKAGYQVAFMAPTEILAKQHFQEVSKFLKNFNLDIGLLTGKEDKFRSKKLKNETIEISRQKLLEKVEKGEIDILIGTHALIQDKIRFGNLALVILDEQHRFGIEQRARLCRPASPKLQRGEGSGGQTKLIPHLLSMTATPIPRTLALTIYGDLDLSLITQLPKGRKKIITKVIPPEERKTAYNFIRKQVKEGRQVFVICPRIEKSTNNESNTNLRISWAEVKAVKEEYEKLSKKIFPDLKVAMLHGRMKPKEKEEIMKKFKNGKIDILVSTSVVEVGIDVPNATLMMIEGAERFGLAQLHQFRGRVGRADFQSYCFLFTDSPAKKTQQRLRALLKAKDGFKLAEKDLEIRGPGAIDGKRQWGIPDITMASLKDISLVEKTRETAKEILEKDPELKKYPLLKKRLDQFGERIHLE